MPSPFISVICFWEEGVIFLPLEPKKERSKKKKPDLKFEYASDQAVEL